MTLTRWNAGQKKDEPETVVIPNGNAVIVMGSMKVGFYLSVHAMRGDQNPVAVFNEWAYAEVVPDPQG